MAFHSFAEEQLTDAFVLKIPGGPAVKLKKELHRDKSDEHTSSCWGMWVYRSRLPKSFFA